MVSGFVTSPCDQLRIFSGDARLMRMESKSVIDVPRSNGLERYKVSSCGFYAAAAVPGILRFLASSQLQPGSIPELSLCGRYRSCRRKALHYLVSRPLRESRVCALPLKS